MRQAYILAYGPEGRLADTLAELALARSLHVREVRQREACLNMLRQGAAAVLVLRLGRDLDKELTLLEQTTNLFPTTPVLVVGPAENPVLEALAWDLGAAYVLFPPQPVESVRDVVLAFLPREPAPEDVADV